MMKKIVVFLCAVLMEVLWSSCNSISDHEAQSYDRSKVAEVIAAHDTTILYFMTSWCQAGQSDFEHNLEPYLEKASDTKAIVVVGLGKIEQFAVVEIVDQNVLIGSAPSRSPLFDRLFINRECKKLLSDYKRVNYVPVRLVCNSKGEILNWNTDKDLDLTYGDLYPYLIGWK